MQLEPDENRFGTVRADGARVSPSRWWDPYGPNRLKGDVPIAGAKSFLVLTAIADSQYTGVQANADADLLQKSNNTLLFSMEYYVGQTVFRPKTFALRATGIARTIVDPDGNAEQVEDVSLGETFVEALLLEHGRRSYDATSARLGVQAFNLDVQGLVVNDALAAGRAFSELAANRVNITMIGARPLEKDAASALATGKILEADFAAASFAVGDAFRPGLNVVAFAAFDDDRRLPGARTRVGWGGLGTQGHIGRVVTAPALYVAWGHKDAGPASQRILAPMAVVDLALPADRWNPRFTMLWAPGDSNPADQNATAYDAFADKVAFGGAGGAGVLAGGGAGVVDAGGAPVTLFRKGSVIPSLRGANAAPNFVHPGIRLVDIGTDLQISPRFATSFDAVLFAWDQPKALAGALGLAAVPDSFAASEWIGQLKIKPFLNEQALIAVSAAALVPSNGLTDLTGSTATVLKADARVLLAF